LKEEYDESVVSEEVQDFQNGEKIISLARQFLEDGESSFSMLSF